MARRQQSTFADVICAIANLDTGEQAKLSSWLTSLACPGFRIRKKGNRHLVNHGDGRLVPVEGDPNFFEACKHLVPFLIRLQRDLWLCPLTAIRQGAEGASQSVVEQVLNRLELTNLRLRRFPRRKRNQELNEAILRLRDEPLPNGEQRSWKQVRARLKAINKDWDYPRDDTVRIRYQRLKRKQSPPGP
jgi:hypothetical protein